MKILEAFVDSVEHMVALIVGAIAIVIVITAFATTPQTEAVAGNGQPTQLKRPFTDANMLRAYRIGQESGTIKNAKDELTGKEKAYLNSVYDNLERLDAERHSQGGSSGYGASSGDWGS